MSAVHEFSVAVRVVSARSDWHEGWQIAVDDWNPNRLAGRVLLRFKTPGGSFDRTVKASVIDREKGDEFALMEAQMLGHLRRHGVVVDHLDWVRGDLREPTEGDQQ